MGLGDERLVHRTALTGIKSREIDIGRRVHVAVEQIPHRELIGIAETMINSLQQLTVTVFLGIGPLIRSNLNIPSVQGDV